MPKKRTPAAERQRDSCDQSLLQVTVTGNRPDAGRAAGPERALTWAGEPMTTEAEGLVN